MNVVQTSKFFTDIGSSEEVQLISYQVNAPLTITPKELKCKSLTLIDCRFLSEVTFDGCNFDCIKFINCEFPISLNILNSTSSGEKKHKTYDSILIENCTINNLYITGGNIQNIKIRLSTTMRTLLIGNLTSANAISLFGVKITYSFRFFYLHLEEGITFSSCEINTEDHTLSGLVDVHADSVYIRKSKLIGTFSIWGGSIKHSLVTMDSTITDDLLIHALKIGGILELLRNDFHKSLTIYLLDKQYRDLTIGSIKSLNLRGTIFGTGFAIYGESHQIDKIEITFDEKMTGTLLFKECIIKELNLLGDNHGSSIFFDYCKFKSLNFEHFNNYNNISFSSCTSFEKDTLLMISNSNLGKTNFFNFYFDKFDRIAIIDSQISDINTAGVYWFKDEQLFVGIDERRNERRREIYRQLKYSSEKQGDRIQALEFKAREMKAFSRMVRNGNYSKGDKFILLISWANNYGLDWLRPLVLIFLSTLLFYPLIIISASPEIIWRFSASKADFLHTMNVLYDNRAIFPQLFNPARIISKVFPDVPQLGLDLHSFDLLQRIFLAVLIFQMISAFRKYVK